MTKLSKLEQMWRNAFPNEEFPDQSKEPMSIDTQEKLQYLFNNEPRAPDGKLYSMENRFLSLFTWGRPPLPALAADLLASVTDEHKIKSALVLGSCCPSVLASIGFGDSERVIRIFDMQSRWNVGYQFLYEDYEHDSKYPKQNNWLPNNNIYHPQEWSWSPKLGEIIFIDQPWKNPSPSKELDFNVILRAIKPRLIVMGFSGELPGPKDLDKLLIEDQWQIKEYHFEQVSTETDEINNYRMLVCLPSEISNNA
jgi:hypothetical protein